MDIGTYVGILGDDAPKNQRAVFTKLEAVNGNIYGRTGIETALHYAGVLRTGALLSTDRISEILGSLASTEMVEFGDVRIWYAGLRPVHAGIVVDAEHVFHARERMGMIEPTETVTRALEELRGTAVTTKDYELNQLMTKYNELNASLF